MATTRDTRGAPDADDEDLVEKYRHSGDPLADMVVDEADQHGGLQEIQRLLNAIINESAIPRPDDYDHLLGGERIAYRHYFDTCPQMPQLFYERCDVSEGSVTRWFDEYGWTAFSILGCAALPDGYSVPEVARALAMTQEIDVHIRKRLYESIQFLVDVMDPDGVHLADDGAIDGQVTLAGFAVERGRKVRLFHAVIRHLIGTTVGEDMSTSDMEPYGEMLLEHEWPAKYGTPINQAQMAGTLLSFGHTLLWGLETLGYDVDEEVQMAYLARWNLIGHVMGVDTALMRWDYPSAHELYDHLRRPGGEPGDSARLTAALVGFMEEAVPWWLFFLRPTASLLIVHLIGEQRASEAGLILSPLKRAWMPINRVLMAGWARLVQRADPMRWLSAWLYRRMRRKVLGGNKPRYFELGPVGGTPGERHLFKFRLPARTPDRSGWVNLGRGKTPSAT